MDIHRFRNRADMKRAFLAPTKIIQALAWLVAAGVCAPTGVAASKTTKSNQEGDFMPYVQLAPFVVNGKQLAISIHARSEKDRRYAETFAEEVVKVVYEGVTPETGKGLVIIGKKDEPHSIFVFRKFQALARAGALDPAVAAHAPELDAMLNHWEDTAGDGTTSGGEGGEDVDIEFEKIITALPLPLEGIGAKLYQLAWGEKFDDAKVEARLRALREDDLAGNMFARFDWVFYLPRRGALEQAIDELVANALKEEDVGFIARTAVKGTMLMVKPMIRKAIEGMRRSILFSTVVEARTEYDHDGVSALTNAYLNVLMPDEKKEGGSEHARAVKAVRAEVQALASNPKGTETEPLETFANGLEKAVEGKAESAAAKFEEQAAKEARLKESE